ncbi:hypothetical protein D3C76_1074770 [compost metagenome]
MAVTGGDEHAVDRGIGLHAQDLCRALGLRSWAVRPVDRRAQQVGTGQRRQAHPFGELQVVADQHADAPVDRFDHRRCGSAGCENFFLRIPQVRLAVHRAQTPGIDQCRAVGQLIPGQTLAESTDDDHVQFTGQRLPQAQGRPLGGFREGQCFRAVGKQVAALHQLRQHHDLGTLQGRRADGALGERAVVGKVTDPGCQLAAGDQGISCSVQRTDSADEWAMAIMSFSLIASMTRRSAARSSERLSR